MLRTLKNLWTKSRLTDKRFEFLFDEPHPDEILIFDCETTGLDPKTDDIISIGAVKIRKDKILLDQAIHILVSQDREIDHKSSTIHQIRNCDLVGAIPVQEAIEKFLYFVGNRPLAGYYLEFDTAMINKYLMKMYGITLPNPQIEVSAMYYDKRIKTIPQGNIDLRFDTILKTLSLPRLNAHDALNDAVMTAMMYLKLNNIKKI